MMVGDHGWRKLGWVALFVLPGFSGLVLFVLGPIFASLVLTVYEWDLLTDPRFVGSGNFRRMWSDSEFWAALRHTLTYIVGYVPLVMATALLIALALNGRIPLRGVLRTAFFMPVVSSWVAVALLWTWLYNPRYGLVNYGLDLIGINGPNWLYDKH